MDGLKRGSAAIVGVAESDLGEVADGMSVTDLMAQGAKRALDDCGQGQRPFVSTRPNWSRSPTSFWPMAANP
jgi:hypothetical protein